MRREEGEGERRGEAVEGRREEGVRERGRTRPPGWRVGTEQAGGPRLLRGASCKSIHLQMYSWRSFPVSCNISSMSSLPPDLKLAKPLGCLASALASPSGAGKSLASRGPSPAAGNLATVLATPLPHLPMALAAPSSTGTRHLHVDFLVLKGSGPSCRFSSWSCANTAASSSTCM